MLRANGAGSLTGIVRQDDNPMKSQIILLLALCSLFSGCERRRETPPVSATVTSQAQTDYDAQLKRQTAQLDANDKLAKQAEEQSQAREVMQKRADATLRAQEDMQKHADALLSSQELMIKRQQDDFARFEKILDTWESQQRQYQKYLDSLEKK
jgi:hypothetical protein